MEWFDTFLPLSLGNLERFIRLPLGSLIISTILKIINLNLLLNVVTI